MLRTWMLRRGPGLYTYTDDCAEQFEVVPWEKPLRIEIAQPRSLKFDRLFHAMVHRIAKSIGHDHSEVLEFFKLETGHYALVTPTHRPLASVQDDLIDRLRSAAEETASQLDRTLMLEAADRVQVLLHRLMNRETIHYKSIAWDKMDGLQFKEFFERCIVIMYERWQIDPALVADLLVPDSWEKKGR